MNKTFICDGCGKEHDEEEFGTNINTPNLAGIVLCKNCIKISKMKKFIGVKLIEAKPMTKHSAIGCEYLAQYVGKEITSNEQDELKLVDGYEVDYGNGYVSWSPKDVFDKAYRQYREYNDIRGLFKPNKEFQKRAHKEAEELQSKYFSLKSFVEVNAAFLTLPVDEQTRLEQQLLAMQYYLTILVERIENFK